MTTKAIFRLETLPDLHRDPFDRLLIAQALEHRLAAVTPDPAIRHHAVPNLWVKARDCGTFSELPLAGAAANPTGGRAKGPHH